MDKNQEKEKVIPPPPPGFVIEETSPPPPGFIKEVGRATVELGLGTVEGIASAATGVTGWVGGKVAGLAKLIYDAWRSGGKDASWQDAQETANKVAEKISSIGGLYKPRTEFGKVIPEVAAAPFTAAGYGIKKGAQALTKDPERQAAIEFVGEIVLASVLPKVGKGIYSYLDKKITSGKSVTVGDLKLAANAVKEPMKEVNEILRDVPDNIEIPIKKLPTPEVPGETAMRLRKRMAEKEAAPALPTPEPVQPTGQPAVMPAPTRANPVLGPGEIQEITQLVKSLKPLGREQKAMYGQEFGRRIAEAEKAGEAVGGGVAGIYAKLSKMKGEYEKVKVDFEPLQNILSEAKQNAMANTIDQHPLLLSGEKLNAGEGLVKLLYGKLPQPKQLELLQEVFGGRMIDALMQQRPLLQRAATLGLEIANIPRSMLASLFDLSFGLRQGSFAAPRYYREFASSWIKQFKEFGEERAYRAAMDVITQDPYFKLAREGRVSFTELGKIMRKREERYASPLAEKIPILGKGIRMTARAYTGFANKFRMDIFRRVAQYSEKMGYKLEGNTELLRAIGGFTNVVTGRGGLGKLEPVALALNAFFFSPRLQSAQMGLLFGKYTPLNPLFYIKLPKPVRVEALKTWLAWTGMGVTILTGAKLAGLKVGDDSRSPNFGKIIVGNTRIDIWAGKQQYMVLTARFISGEMVSSTTGKVTRLGEGYKPLTPLGLAGQFVEYKEAPIFSFATNWLKGQSTFGEKFSLKKEIPQRFVPIVAQDLWDIYKDDPKLLPLGLFAVFGAGLQTYRPKERLLR